MEEFLQFIQNQLETGVITQEQFDLLSAEFTKISEPYKEKKFTQADIDNAVKTRLARLEPLKDENENLKNEIEELKKASNVETDPAILENLNKEIETLKTQLTEKDNLFNDINSKYQGYAKKESLNKAINGRKILDEFLNTLTDEDFKDENILKTKVDEAYRVQQEKLAMFGFSTGFGDNTNPETNKKTSTMSDTDLLVSNLNFK